MDASGSPRGASDDLDRSDPDLADRSAARKSLHAAGLPDDLPKSLDDRRSIPLIQPETEMYDAWQGALLPLLTCRA